MFESIRQYLQDWSDACEYAAECWPATPFLNLNDLSFREPYTALGAIALICCVVWALNERSLARLARQAARRTPAPRPAAQPLIRETQDATAKKLAA
jgi:hypothetical protein